MSMRRIDLSLGITADAKQAQATLQNLKTSLNEIAATPLSFGGKVSQELQVAANSAKELQHHISLAMDAKTGNINLDKLQSSLQSSNTSLSTLTTNLLNAGLTGEKAFIGVYTAIAQSNIQLKTSNGLLSQFALTLKNTAKWQLSSSLLHGVISGFQNAINYAKDLDKSLTDISIVTNKNRDSMAEFAKEANKAAKELRTTTTAYTDASLIYYQQGLSDEEVKNRTDTTIKMANALGESAKEVSSYMTAIWNNFDDGSKSLEYYGDVVTNLGAKTASSSAEIAAGLEKFASIGNTVGLSYEYATSALATVVAETRQSADTVGTAFKTLFSRIQGLQLGETQEDGTDLNKYSKALAVVGVNIKDSNGELKQMDTILDELGGKWKTLANDEKMALAQTVAGVRQYTQLISLMENYDTFRQNVGYAEDSSGTLAEQQLDYEKSWAGASKKLKASGEGLITELFPTDAIVDFTNGLADVVDGFSSIVDAAGGLKTILLLISTVVLSKFQTQIALALDNGISKMSTLIDTTGGFKGILSSLGTNIKNALIKPFSDIRTSWNQGMSAFSEAAGQTYQKRSSDARQAQEQKWSAPANKTSEESHKAFNAVLSGKQGNMSTAFVAQVQSLEKIQGYHDQILNLGGLITQQDRETLSEQLKQIQALDDKKAKLLEQQEILQQNKELIAQDQFLNFDQNLTSLGNGAGYVSKKGVAVSEDNQTMVEGFMRGAGAEVGQADGGLTAVFGSSSEAQVAQEQILETVSTTSKVETEIADIIDNQVIDYKQKKELIEKSLKAAEKTKSVSKEQTQAIRDQLKGWRGGADKAEQIKNSASQMSKNAKTAAQTMGVLNKNILAASKNGKDIATNFRDTKTATAEATNATNNFAQTLDAIKARASSISQGLVKGFQGVSQLLMGVNMLSSAITNLKEEGVSLSSIASIFMGISMTLPAALNVINMMTGAFGAMTTAIGLNTIAKALNDKQTKEGLASSLFEILTKKELNNENKEQIITEMAASIAKTTGANASASAAMAESIYSQAKNAGTAATTANTIATWLNGEAIKAHPIMWIITIIIAVIAAVALLTAGLIKMAAEAKAENLKMQAEAMQKLADASNETAKANQELINSYNELFAAYAEGAENQEELRKKSLEIAEAYGNEAMKIAALRGEYDKFNKLLVEERKKEIKKTKKDNDAAVRAGAKEMSNKMREGDGHKTSSGGFYQEFDTGWSTADEWFATSAINKDQDQYQYLKLQGGTQGDVELDIDNIEDPNQILGAYAEVQQWVDEMNQMAASNSSIKLGESEMYSEAMEFLSEHKEMYDKAKEYADANKELIIEEKALNTELQDGQGIYDIDSLKEYTQYKEKYLDSIKKEYSYLENTDPEAYNKVIEDAEAFLNNYTHLAEFKTQDTLVGVVADEDEKQKIIDWMDTLSEDEYAQVVMNLNKDSTLDELKSDLEEIQKEIDASNLSLRIQGKIDLQNLYESGSTDKTQIYDIMAQSLGFEDYADLEENGSESQQKEIEDFYLKYVTSSRKEQKEMIDEIDTGVDWNSATNVDQIAEDKVADTNKQEADKKAKQAADDKAKADTKNYEQYSSYWDAKKEFDELSIWDDEFIGYRQGDDWEAAKVKAKEWADDRWNYVYNLMKDEGYSSEDAAKRADELYQENYEDSLKGSIQEDWINDRSDELVQEKYDEIYQDTYEEEYDKELNKAKETEEQDILVKKAEEIEKFNKVYEKTIELEGLESDEVYDLVDIYQEYGGSIEGVSEDLKDNEVWSKKVALANSKSGKSLDNLSSKWEDLSDNLLSTDFTTQTKAVQEMDEEVSDLFNVEEGTFSDAFLTNATNVDLFTEAIAGNEEAWKQYVNNAYLDIAGSQNAALVQEMQAFANQLEIGEELEGDQVQSLFNWANSLYESGIGVDQINKLMTSMGYSVAFTTEMFADGVVAVNEYSDAIGFFGGAMAAYSSFKSEIDDDDKEVKELKFLDEEIERYYRISKLLDKNATKQERLSQIKEKSYGAKKLKAIEEETKALEEQLSLQDQYINELYDKAEKDKGAIAYFGATFDDQGLITNYEDMMQQQINEYNKAVEAYNASAQTESDKSMLEAAEERFDLFQESLEQYDETIADIDTATTEKLEIQNNLIDKALEKLQTKIEIKIEVNTMELERLEYFLEKLDDPIGDAIEAMTNLGEQTTQIISKNKEIQNGINELLDISKTRDLTADEIEQLKEWRNELYENNKTLAEIEDSVSEYLVNAFEDWNEQMEKSIENLDTLTNKLETYASIIDIVGKDTLGLSSKLVIDLAKSKLDTSKTNLEVTKIRLKDQKEALAEAEKQLAEATTDEEKETAQTLVDTIKESVAELESSVNDWWTTSLEDAANVFSKQMEKITEDLNNAFGGAFGSLDDLQTYQERQSKLSSQYLADYEKVYELNKLNRSIEKDIDKTDNVKAQRELAALQNEINEMMNSNEKVSKRDIEYAQKKYDLKLAEIALEEAQNAKSQVRMTRDNEGNWSYTYTADNSKVQDAEQNYEDKLYSLQDFATKSIQELESSFLSLEKEMIEKLSEIDQTTEEGKAKYEEIKNYYLELMNNNLLENQKILENNRQMNAEYNILLADDFNDTLFNKIYPDYDNFEQVKSDIDEKITQSLIDLGQAFSNWQVEISDIFNLAEEPIENFGTVTMPNLYTNTKDANDKIVVNVETTRKNTNDKFNNIITNLGTWYTKYKEPIDKATTENEELAESVQALVESYNNLDQQENIVITVTTPGLDTLKTDLDNIEEQIARINSTIVSPQGSGGNLPSGSVVTGTAQGTKHTGYQINGSWYNSNQVTNMGNGNFSVNEGEVGVENKEDLFEEISLSDVSRTHENAEAVKIYDSNMDMPAQYAVSPADHGALVNALKDRKIIGYTFSQRHNANLYKLDEPINIRWYFHGGVYSHELAYLNQTDLHQLKNQEGQTAFKDRYNLQKFNTGGYTGDWGNEGRLAMLHQKEIVLNASDTENFLKAVEIVRELASIIDLNAQAASFGLGNINASAVQNHNQTIEQEVTIHAEFPNATNHSEIEEAFNNLINTASQYANRKNR